MTFVQKAVIGSKPVTERKNFIWNMIGSTLFAAVSMCLSFVVIRVMGENLGGVFSIAITISQMMQFIAYYETRTFQVTDVNSKYQFGEYKAAKLLLALFMIAASVIYIWVREGSFADKALVILLMCVYRMIDGYADLYEGSFQKDGRLDLTGKSQAFRTVLSAGVMVIALCLTKQLVLSIVLAIAAAFAGLFLFDIHIMRLFHKLTPLFHKEKVWGILKECFPLFLGSFLWTYILSAGRIAIDGNMASNFQSYYQMLFLPVNIVNLCATFVMKPLLPRLAESYSRKEWKEFRGLVGKITAVIAGFTVLCMVLAFFLGIPVLSLLSGCDLQEYREILVFLMLAGGINSLAYFMYYILTVMRNNKGVFTGYVTAAVLTVVISGQMVQRSGIAGAAGSFFITVLYLMLIFLAFIAVELKKQK